MSTPGHDDVTARAAVRHQSSRQTDSGLVIVDKPSGITSHDVVARIRRLAGTRKVGHAGTLDPMATGVMVLGINRATRLLGHLTLADKRYTATLRLGSATTTDDAEGEFLPAADPQTLERRLSEIDLAFVEEGLREQIGEIRQRPSAVSAIKIDGKRAYARVRDGEQVSLPPRVVRVHGIDVGQFQRLPGGHIDVSVSVHCSSGTYIRAIARDLGERFSVGGHLVSLRRTAVGPYRVSQARTLDQLSDRLDVKSMTDAVPETFTTCVLDEENAQNVRFGRALALELDRITALFSPEGEFLALYEPREGGGSRPVAVFV